MNELSQVEKIDNIESYIFTIRGLQVMLDSDLAKLYGVESKRLNEQVKRNILRFPDHFRFQLTDEEYNCLRSQIATLKNQGKDLANLKSQIATSSLHGGRRTIPYVFTEQGVSMLSAVLKSDTAIEVSIKIIDSFVSMRKFLSTNSSLFNRLDNMEKSQLTYQIESDKKFDQIFNALEDKSIQNKQGVFFDGQIFDAYSFVSDLIRSAKTSIVLIDNYIDDTVLIHFTKRQKNVNFLILTKTISRSLSLDVKRYNKQYSPVNIKEFKDSHDRFLIIDKTQVYHFGASLKDLGKKWFAFSKMDKSSVTILNRLSEMGLV
ncbi:MAG: DNA-binding protein [Candidatus Cloacimonadota bacterium]|nr:MAG: DNA-binding protein [Candidatus Cloacimonadota bacterium]